jgi:indole-3-glycerol phosphate synthase
MIPAGITTIAESGIFTAADVERLAKTKIDAILVGEALITAPNIALKVRELASSTGEN